MYMYVDHADRPRPDHCFKIRPLHLFGWRHGLQVLDDVDDGVDGVLRRLHGLAADAHQLHELGLNSGVKVTILGSLDDILAFKMHFFFNSEIFGITKQRIFTPTFPMWVNLKLASGDLGSML
jgi:hypothetical protein